MDTTLLYDNHVNDELITEWSKRKTAQHYHPTRVTWWCRNVKHRILYFFNSRKKQKREHHRKMENLYYQDLHDILRGPKNFKDKALAPKNLKGKTLRLISAYHRKIMLDSGQHFGYMEEGPTLYHIIRGRKRREQRTTHYIQLENGQTLETTHKIIRAFRDHFQTKYNLIPCEDTQYQMLITHNEAHTKLCRRSAYGTNNTWRTTYITQSTKSEK
jgi:hypothetical protein